MELSTLVCDQGRQKHHSVLWPGHSQGGTRCGNIPTAFSSNLLVHSFSGCCVSPSCEPGLEAGLWEVREEEKVHALPSRNWHRLLQSPHRGWPRPPSLISSRPSLYSQSHHDKDKAINIPMTLKFIPPDLHSAVYSTSSFYIWWASQINLSRNLLLNPPQLNKCQYHSGQKPNRHPGVFLSHRISSINFFLRHTSHQEHKR